MASSVAPLNAEAEVFLLSSFFSLFDFVLWLFVYFENSFDHDEASQYVLKYRVGVPGRFGSGVHAHA